MEHIGSPSVLLSNFSFIFIKTKWHYGVEININKIFGSFLSLQNYHGAISLLHYFSIFNALSILRFFYRLCKMMSHKNCKDHLLRVMPMGIRILIMHDL